MNDDLPCGRHRVVTGRGGRIGPVRIADRLQLCFQIAIVVAGEAGVEALRETEPLEKMRLPQVADVVIDAAVLIPSQHRPEMAGQHREKQDGEDGFAGMDFLHRDHDAAGGAGAALAECEIEIGR
ncbi:hypothetical protein ACVWWR_005134 [Bradyrhizobium sp. LM3.2]